jgi:hypothetical protein
MYVVRDVGAVGRLVALELVPARAGLDPGTLRRFAAQVREAERAEHPGLVEVLDVTHDARAARRGSWRLSDGARSRPADPLRGRQPRSTASGLMV